MADEDVKLAFYNVTECGFYDLDSKQHAFCSETVLLNDLAEWVARDRKPLIQTRTFDPTDRKMGVYCLGVDRHDQTQDFLLATWNEMPATDGQAASISGDVAPSEARVEMSDFAPNFIPGYATYFWFLPQHRLMATVRFQHIENGNSGLSPYLRMFLAKLSPHAVVERPAADGQGPVRILGYRRLPDQPPQRFRVAFKTALRRAHGRIAEIRDRRGEIRRIIRRDTLKQYVFPNLMAFQRVLRIFGMSGRPPASVQGTQFEYRLDIQPTGPELEEIIASWEANHDEQWDDIGFEFSGESGTTWLTHGSIRRELRMPITRHNAEVVDRRALLNELAARRDDILEAVLRSPREE